MRRALAGLPPWVHRHVPAVGWLAAYDVDHDLSHDIVAGLTVGIMAIPQGMAYGALAGLPPIHGLYTAFVPLLVYAVLGTSRHLQVGPVAIISMLVHDAIGLQHKRAVDVGVQLALICGVLQLLAGLVRLGQLVHLLSHGVVGGFTSAAAILIGLSQAKGFFGIQMAGHHGIHGVVWDLVHGLSTADIRSLWTTLFASSTLALLCAARFIGNLPRAFPHRFIVVAAATFITWALHLHSSAGLAITGHVPQGLPSFHAPHLQAATSLLAPALVIVVLSFMESIAIAQKFALKNNYDVCASQELIALGVSNIAGSFFGAYPSAGSLSRSAVNESTGAKSALAAVVTALVVMLTLLVLTPFVFYVPICVLSAVIIEAAATLVDFEQVRRTWKVRRKDAAVWITTFAGTLLLNVEMGILLGVVTSLVLLLLPRPCSAALQLLNGSLGTVTCAPETAAGDPLALRYLVKGMLCFVNATSALQPVQHTAVDKEVRSVLLDAHALLDLDCEAVDALQHLRRDLEAHHIVLEIVGANSAVLGMLHRAGMDLRPDSMAVPGEMGVGISHESHASGLAHLHKPEA